MSEPALRPRPAVTPDTAPWWRGLDDHQLLIQQCTSCKSLQHPPEPACMSCGSFDVGWTVASGVAEIYSFVVYHEPKLPGFEVPYVVAVATLAEGTRIVADVVDCDPAEVRIGRAVTVDFARIDDGLTLPVLRLVPDNGSDGSGRPGTP